MSLLRYAPALLTAFFATSAIAEDASPHVNIQLNEVDTFGEGCRLTFVLKSTFPQDIDDIVAETVLFSKEGGVILLTLFDFGALPTGRPRVRRFQIPDNSCDSIGQVLINGLDNCTIAGAASDTCEANLTVSSRVHIALEG